MQYKQEWIAALRSGEYKQGTGILYNTQKDKYCCLGVYCKVSGLNITLSGYSPMLGENILTHDVAFPFKYEDFVNMNDSELKSFLEIADYIENNL